MSHKQKNKSDKKGTSKDKIRKWVVWVLIVYAVTNQDIEQYRGTALQDIHIEVTIQLQATVEVEAGISN